MILEPGAEKNKNAISQKLNKLFKLYNWLVVYTYFILAEQLFICGKKNWTPYGPKMVTIFFISIKNESA